MGWKFQNWFNCCKWSRKYILSPTYQITQPLASDSQRIEDETNAVSNFSNTTDNYDPSDLDDENEEDDVEDCGSEDSHVNEPDLNEGEISRVFTNIDDDVLDPDEIDGTTDFDEEMNPADIKITDDNDFELTNRWS